MGPVRRVRTEIASSLMRMERCSKAQHAVLEIVSYDVKGTNGRKPVLSSRGREHYRKEVYKYDDKGNISEMTLLNDDGRY